MVNTIALLLKSCVAGHHTILLNTHRCITELVFAK